MSLILQFFRYAYWKSSNCFFLFFSFQILQLWHQHMTLPITTIHWWVCKLICKWLLQVILLFWQPQQPLQHVCIAALKHLSLYKSKCCCCKTTVLPKWMHIKMHKSAYNADCAYTLVEYQSILENLNRRTSLKNLPIHSERWSNAFWSSEDVPNPKKI